MIPFSIWSNNDLWNLLPAHARVNSRKSDAIPAPALVRRREGRIREYWCLLKSANRNRYQQELQMSLLGSGYSGNDWEQSAMDALEDRCSYLINDRGFEAFTG